MTPSLRNLFARVLPLLALAVTAAAAAGCGTEIDADIGAVTGAVLNARDNGLSTSNRLSTSNGLMTTASGRVMVKYLARCALTATQTRIKSDQYGTVYPFAGTIGLPSAWPTGMCDSGCQERVAACLLPMANRDGEHVALELVSAASTMKSMYTCTGTDSARAEQVKRFCIDGTGCDLFTKGGACTQTNAVELHLDALTGPVIASIATVSTGSTTTEKVLAAPIASAGISGRQNVVAYFDGAANRAFALNGGGKVIAVISSFRNRVRGERRSSGGERRACKQPGRAGNRSPGFVILV